MNYIILYTKHARPRIINGLRAKSTRKLHRTESTAEGNMAFITEKAELKPGLILFRRGDVDHRMWYCRMKMPKADRYKTVSLKTTDISAARERAFDQDVDVRFRIK